MYKSYEELDVWKRAVELAVEVYGVLKDCRDFGLKDQMTRAAVSVSSNIAEGMERDSVKESIHFLHIAKGSCAELRTQLIIAGRVGAVDTVEADHLRTECVEISKMLQGLVRSMKC
ncbi:MAG: four helix bundle protein [Bacteroidia bacterium]|nr:four helix bundle protein [Bacteroidia bacterium]